MRLLKLLPVASLLVLTLVLLWWLADRGDAPPAPAPAAATAPATRPLRIGLIPERDVVDQRKRYQALADYLARKLDRPVQLATLNTYEAILLDFADKRVDGAFLGSLIALLTVDRHGGQVVVKPEMLDGRTTYRGTAFVLEGSGIRGWSDLAGRSLAMVRTTTGGNLYPMAQLKAHGLLEGEQAPRIVWCGTHDEAIEAVANRLADAAAVKDLRLEEYLSGHPALRIRRLGDSAAVPNNALVLRADTDADLARRITDILLTMNEDAEGRAALQAFGARRFVPCELGEYHVIYDMVADIGSAWSRLGIAGPAPTTRATTRP